MNPCMNSFISSTVMWKQEIKDLWHIWSIHQLCEADLCRPYGRPWEAHTIRPPTASHFSLPQPPTSKPPTASHFSLPRHIPLQPPTVTSQIRPPTASHFSLPWASHFGLPRPPTSASHCGPPLRPPWFGLPLRPHTVASHFGLPHFSQFGLLTASHCLAQSIPHGLPLPPNSASHMSLKIGLPIWPYGRPWEAEVGGWSGRHEVTRP